MASPATRAKTGPKQGVRQHRQPKVQSLPEPAPLELWDEALDAKEWNDRRVEAWQAWAKMLHPVDRYWPPHSAVHDGLHGISAGWPPKGLDEKAGAIWRAEKALGEVAKFRKAKPKAAESIAGPLREYESRLRRIRDKLGAYPR